MKIASALAMLLLAAAAIGGCALSPQTAALRPYIDVESHPVGRGRELALEVVDARPTREFGARGGVYDSAFISPRTDVAQTVRQALAERLRASRFVVTEPRPGAPLSMRVAIERIDYRASGGPLAGEVRVSAAIRAIIRNGGRTLSTQYQANTARQVVTAPSEAKNEAMLNEVVSQVLQRLLRDRAVWDLLSA